jgi:carbonic anhydrase
MPVDPTLPPMDDNVHLAQAPTNPREFHALAVQMAKILDMSRDRRMPEIASPKFEVDGKPAEDPATRGTT